MASLILHRFPGLRRIERHLRLRWQSMRPLPIPRYVPGTPDTGGSDPLDPYFRPTAATLASAAMSEEAADFVSDVLDRLTPSDELAALRFFHATARAKFGEHWQHANLLTTLWAAATLIRPISYLEIGVHRGRSAAVVGGVRPECAIYGFDVWVENYAGVANPGPDFVRGELQKIGHRGDVILQSGDSRDTLPAFLGERKDLFFDLITIDGGKAVATVASDFANALARLKVGGIIVFDDMALLQPLRRVWNRMIRRDGRYVSWEFLDADLGVAAAIRVSDEAPLALLPRLTPWRALKQPPQSSSERSSGQETQQRD